MVALVLAVRQALLRQRLDQRLLAQAQKRPQHHPAAKRHARPHSAEPIRARAAQEALVLALRRAQDKVPAATKPLAAADCRDAAALEALNAAFLAE